MPGNKVLNKIIAIVNRRFKSNDDAAFVKEFQGRERHTEAIIVICEIKRFNEDFVISRKAEVRWLNLVKSGAPPFFFILMMWHSLTITIVELIEIIAWRLVMDRCTAQYKQFREYNSNIFSKAVELKDKIKS